MNEFAKNLQDCRSMRRSEPGNQQQKPKQRSCDSRFTLAEGLLMNMDISIQQGTAEHLSGIHSLVLEWGYSANESQTGAWLEALLASPNYHMLVATSNAAVVGWAVAEKRISIGELFTAEITGLVVSTSARRAGVGRLLVQAIEDWSRAKGLSRVVVRSNISRSESHGFYPSIGFERTKTTHVYVKDLEGSEL